MQSVMLMQAIQKAIGKLLIKSKVFRITLQGNLLLTALNITFLYFLSTVYRSIMITDIQTSYNDFFNAVLSNAKYCSVHRSLQVHLSDRTRVLRVCVTCAWSG